MNNKILYKITITGRVQGVGFRWSAMNEARVRGIAGYVKNMSDGSVYIEAEGNPEQVDTFIEWCKRGPGFGYVESVTMKPFTPVGYVDFRIVR